MGIYRPLKIISDHQLTKNGERGRVEICSCEDGGRVPSVADDLRIVEGRDAV